MPRILESRRRAAAAALALALSCRAAGAAGLEPSRPSGGIWWVIVASPDVDVYFEAVVDISHPYWREVERTRETAARCGFEIMTEQAARFEGFDPGRMAFVAGGFATKPVAQKALARLRPCFADAYIRSGSYADWD